MGKNHATACIDALLYVLLIHLIGELYVSQYGTFISINGYLFISVFCALVSCAAYVFFILKISNNKTLLWFAFADVLAMILFNIILFVFLLTFNNTGLPSHEVKSGDGIALLIIQGVYITVNVVLRIGLFIIALIKNAVKKNTTGILTKQSTAEFHSPKELEGEQESVLAHSAARWIAAFISDSDPSLRTPKRCKHHLGNPSRASLPREADFSSDEEWSGEEA